MNEKSTAPQQEQTNTGQAGQYDPRAANAKCIDASLLKTAEERTYGIRGTAAFIRKLARTSTEADRKLRQQCPQAFVGEPLPIVSLGSDDWAGLDRLFVELGPSFTDQCAPVMVEQYGPYAGGGLHLASHYQWEIVPAGNGIDSTLVARRKF